MLYHIQKYFSLFQCGMDTSLALNTKVTALAVWQLLQLAEPCLLMMALVLSLRSAGLDNDVFKTYDQLQVWSSDK